MPSRTAPPSEGGFSTYRENALHASLKEHYAGPEARFEVEVEGFVADAVRDGVLIEIQTANFGAMRKKLGVLLPHHPVRLVHPVAVERYLLREDVTGARLSRRRSPKKGRWEDVYLELVAFPELMREPNFTLVVALVHEEEVRMVDGVKRRRGRDWRKVERRLLEVVGERTFAEVGDLQRALPPDLPSPFTTADLASAGQLPRWLAQKMAYCLRRMHAIVAVGKQGNAIEYELTGAPQAES